MDARRTFVVGLTFMIAGMMLISAAPNSASETADGDAATVLIFSDEMNLDRLMADTGISKLVDYGSFDLAKASPGALDLLREYDIYFEYANYRVGVGEYSFDTSLGEPSMPPSLRLSEYPGETGYYIIQMIGPMNSDWVQTIESDGIRVVDHLNNAIIVEASPAQAGALYGHDFVHWVGLYQPAYKLSAYLVDDDTQIVDISLFRGENGADALAALSGMGAEIQDFADLEMGGIITASVPAHLIDDIAGLKSVSKISPDAQPALYNDIATRVIQSGVASTSGARVVFDKGIHGEGQLVSYADTGLTTGHEAFVDSSNPIGTTHRKVRDYYAPPGGGDLLDGHGHGTHVAGTIGGDSDPWLSYAERDGHAYAAKLIMADIGIGTGINVPADYADIYNQAYADGAKISSNSWGTSYSNAPYSDPYPNEAIMLDDYVWDHKDFLFVWAAGNSGSVSSSIGFECQAKNTLIVGGTDNGANANNMYTYSSRGPTKDLRLAPHILAPAVNIYSADFDALTSYVTMSGTSMATPDVAGNVALVRQYLAEGWYPQGTKNSGDPITNPSAALMKTLMTIAGKEITGTGAYLQGAIYPNNDQGWGRLYIDEVLYFEGDAKKLLFWDSPTSLSTGGSWQQTFTVSDSTVPLRIMTTWTDYPAAVAANPAIINDLDLTVTDPLGNIYRGNVFTGSNPGRSTTGGSYDRLNTLEAVNLVPGYGAGAPVGTYTITINAYNVQNGPQPFSISVLGGIQVISSEGTIDIEDTIYPREASVLIEVQDTDLNNNPGTTQTVNVNLRSVAEPAGETTVLTETTVNSGVFRGTKTISATNSAGVLLVNTADTLTATYNDADDGSGSPATVTDTATVDGTVPSAPTGLTVQHYGAGATPGTATLTTAGTTAAGGPHNVWFTVVDSSAGSEFTTPNSVAEFTDAYYNAASTSNDVRAGPSSAPPTGDYEFVKCQFATSVTPSTVVNITLTFEGYFSAALTGTMYAWDGSAWDAIGSTQSFLTTDTTMTRTITTTPGSYISGGNVLWGVWAGTTRRSATVDFLQVTVNYQIPYTTMDDNTLNWTASGSADLDHYNVYRSDLQAGTYTLIGSSPAGTNTYQDNGKGVADSTLWWYRVRAVDAIGNEETNTVSVQEPGIITPLVYEINLSGKAAGSWVFVSFPSGSTGTIQSILTDGGPDGDGATTWDLAKWYNPQTPADPWKTYRLSGSANDMPTISNTMGFWIHLVTNGGDQQLTLASYVAIPASTGINLYAGWNLVGYPSMTNRVGTTLPSQVDIVSVFSGSATYTDYTNKASVNLVNGNAYFMHATANVLWTVTNP